MTNKEQIRKERIEFCRDFLHSAVFGLIVIFVAFGILIASNVLIARWNTSVDAKMAEVNDLAAKVTQSNAQSQMLEENNKYFNSGVDLDRKANDDEIMRQFLQNYGCWSSFEDLQSKSSAVYSQYENVGVGLKTLVTPWIDGLRLQTALRTTIVRLTSSEDVCKQTCSLVNSYVVETSADNYVYYAEIQFDMEAGTLSDHATRLVKYTMTSDGLMLNSTVWTCYTN